ncbi:manganese efflux pump MntP [Coprobacter tertius]|uniref:Putative manganese efflux pump MntP n=1 Tax=Coprobacter tertius TaxID=2944915 RepID=A0ABT1MI71_9BACT|nr:manganese efflux pump MntP family protein [Coprobacter tertius]MCP9612325.1 manganese efflux pump MntP family protein [Coprobacter tertius]
MGIFEILLLAIGLSMDCFAVSLTMGTVMHPLRWKKVLKVSAFFGIFQGGMPLIGWWLGHGFRRYIESYDHWIAFTLLLFLGGKMIYEGSKREEDRPVCFDPTCTRTLIGLSVATSIDALAVGISFAFLNMNMCIPTLIITFTTIIISLIGQYIGKCFGRRLKTGAEVIGGIILILIGVKILIEHLYFQ